MTATNTAPDYAEQAPALAYFTNPKRGGLLVGAGPVFWVAFCGAVLISAIIAGTGIVVSSFRDREIQRSERELENTVHLLARHFDRQIESFESVHRALAAEIEHRVKTPDEFKRILSTEEVHHLIRNKISDSVDFAGVNLFDSDGSFINSSERWPVPSVNLSDRKYFKAFKAHLNNSPVLIELVESRVSCGRTIVIARKISGANGEFLGMITRSMAPEYFEAFFSSVVLPFGAISLLHQDGTLLARYPHVAGAVGQSFSESPLLAGATEGNTTIQLVSPIDGEERLASLRNLPRYPLAVVATTTVSAALWALVYFLGNTGKTKPMFDPGLTGRVQATNLCRLDYRCAMAGSCSVDLLRIIATSLRIS